MQRAVDVGLKALLQAPVDSAEAATEAKRLMQPLESREREANRTFAVLLEKQMWYGAGKNFKMLMPIRRCGALQAGEERKWKLIPDPFTGVPRRRSVVKEANGKEVLEAPLQLETGKPPQADAWHVVADCGSLGRPALQWLIGAVGVSGTLLEDRPHRMICDLTEGESFAGLTLCRLEWTSVLRLRVAPFGKGA